MESVLAGGTSRQLLRKLLDRQRFVFYPMAKGKARWYDLGVTPTLDRFFGAVPQLEKAVASPRGFEAHGNLANHWTSGDREGRLKAA